MNGNIVLGAPFPDCKTTGFLFVEPGGSFGKVGLVKCLFNVHEKPTKFDHSIRASCTSRVKIFGAIISYACYNEQVRMIENLLLCSQSPLSGATKWCR